mmetsp:Transcript_15605/g.39696  ORF Transcript_15605/g.39696 Transcript_15605/m.39696 type:complete len:277 (+) Transcript_15605:1869-2699(+)
MPCCSSPRLGLEEDLVNVEVDLPRDLLQVEDAEVLVQLVQLELARALNSVLGEFLQGMARHLLQDRLLQGLPAHDAADVVGREPMLHPDLEQDVADPEDELALGPQGDSVRGEPLEVLFHVQRADVLKHLLVKGLAGLGPVDPVEADVAEAAGEAVAVVDGHQRPLALVRLAPRQHVRPVPVRVGQPDVQQRDLVHLVLPEAGDPHLLAVRLVRHEHLDAAPLALGPVPVDARKLLVRSLLQAHHGRRGHLRQTPVVQDVGRELTLRAFPGQGALP